MSDKPRPRSGDVSLDEVTDGQIRAFADASPDGIVAARADGTVLVCNRHASALLDIPAASAVGERLPDVLRLQDQEGRTWVDVNRPFSALAIQHSVPEQSWIGPGGEEVLTTARILRREELGPITGLTVSLRSGRGRARLDRDRSDLVATVAHELRSPLTGVKGFVGALLNRWDKLSDDQRKLMLTTVLSDADRLARLIAELLDVARIDTGRLQLYPRGSDVGVLVERVVQSVRAGTSRPVELSAAPGLPEIFADPDKFSQVVTNLVENGVKHGHGTVRVSLAPGPAGVRITVDDEGVGIAPEMRRRVFTKFWTSGTSGGSGLGMYIVGGLTRAHGGAVTIEDAPGGGARVVVDWPSEDLRPD